MYGIRNNVDTKNPKQYIGANILINKGISLNKREIETAKLYWG